MADNQKINELLKKLNVLARRQEEFSQEIIQLRAEINRLRIADSLQEETPHRDIPITKEPEITKPEVTKSDENIASDSKKVIPPLPSHYLRKDSPTIKPPSDLEKFIGQNLISILGISILVIGVAIGVRYSIERDLISPLTRIILGYLLGIGVLGTGIYLKKKYETFSAVLVSGAMAIFYFVTFAAYSFYSLIPISFTFALMVIFTAFTVFAALNYNKPVIAHIGLVGAYAVPFLLSTGSNNYAFLFTYMAIINVGILVISFYKNWKSLTYAAFGLTWLIYLGWYLENYFDDTDFSLAFTFLFIFFITFYVTIIAYKLLKQEKFNKGDVALILINSFIFYGIGFDLLSDRENGSELLGLFTLLNAVIHFIMASLIYRQKVADKNLLYFIIGLVLVFITIAIPVQLDGNWVTLLWIGEAALLFWIGRTKEVPFYEKMSYILMIIAFFSLAEDWSNYLINPDYILTYEFLTPIFNIQFLSSLLFIIALGFIVYLNNDKKYPPAFGAQNSLTKFIYFALPVVLVFIVYFTFYIEISNYWSIKYHNSIINSVESEINYGGIQNNDLLNFRTIWLINYSLLFVSLLAFPNFKKFKNGDYGRINLLLIAICIFSFLVKGLYDISELRESYLNQTNGEYYVIGSNYILIRYISYLFVCLALYVFYLYKKQSFMKMDLQKPYDFLLYGTIFWISSSELINWMDLSHSDQSYKLALSILWGLYSLFLIALGIWKKKKYLRISGIVLFGITLIKLFFYDLSDLSTISKTIVFVTLGILLLLISFLYNKYKNVIFDETSN